MVCCMLDKMLGARVVESDVGSHQQQPHLLFMILGVTSRLDGHHLLNRNNDLAVTTSAWR